MIGYKNGKPLPDRFKRSSPNEVPFCERSREEGISKKTNAARYLTSRAFTMTVKYIIHRNEAIIDDY
jgi:hypothetical protein